MIKLPILPVAASLYIAPPCAAEFDVKVESAIFADASPSASFHTFAYKAPPFPTAEFEVNVEFETVKPEFVWSWRVFLVEIAPPSPFAVFFYIGRQRQGCRRANRKRQVLPERL